VEGADAQRFQLRHLGQQRQRLRGREAGDEHGEGQGVVDQHRRARRIGEHARARHRVEEGGAGQRAHHREALGEGLDQGRDEGIAMHGQPRAFDARHRQGLGAFQPGAEGALFLEAAHAASAGRQQAAPRRRSASRACSRSTG
jgi:hypothetical protein